MERQTRNTKQRAVILQKLRETKSHPTADEVYSMTRASLPHISLGTVYRNLEMLARQGEIICLESGGAQKRFDGDTRRHSHVRCTVCGALGDVSALVPLPDFADIPVEGFTVSGVTVLFDGVCDRCKQAGAAPRQP
jgi:Fur family ferric uptake transcriptional regulator